MEFDPTIADVHTQPTDAYGAPVGRVLHVATGMPRTMVVTVETCTGPRAYVGLASSYFERVTDLMSRIPKGFLVFSGDDAAALGYIQMGAHGVISVTANVAPRLMAEMYTAARGGDALRAIEINNRLLPLHKSLFVETNPIPVNARRHFEIGGTGLEQPRRMVMQHQFAALGHTGQRQHTAHIAAEHDPRRRDQVLVVNRTHETDFVATGQLDCHPHGGRGLRGQARLTGCLRADLHHTLAGHVFRGFFFAAGKSTLLRINR